MTSPKPTSIPTFYKIFFLYIDPLICLSGVYLSYLGHSTYILHGMPKSLLTTPPTAPSSSATTIVPSSTDLTPIVQYLLFNIGALFFFILAMQILLLRQALSFPPSITLRVWKTVQLGILFVDVGMLYAAYEADAAGLLKVWNWGGDEWGNYGCLLFVGVVRGAFIGGIGF